MEDIKQLRMKPDPNRHMLVDDIVPFGIDGKPRVNAYIQTNPAKFLRENNHRVVTAWGCLTENYRPGKYREFTENINANEQYFTHQNVASAFKAKRRHAGKTAHIVNSGPSLLHEKAAFLDELRPDQYVIAVNKATSVLDRIDYIPWTERTAPAKSFIFPKKDTSIWTAPFCHPESFEFCHTNKVEVYNLGATNSIAKDAVERWNSRCEGSRLLNLPGLVETTQLALAMAFWMGFKRVVLWACEYCWYDPDFYYFTGGRIPPPEYYYERYVSSGQEGTQPKEQVLYTYRQFEWVDKAMEPIFTAPFLLQRAYQLNAAIRAYRNEGMNIEIRSKRGLVTGEVNVMKDRWRFRE